MAFNNVPEGQRQVRTVGPLERESLSTVEGESAHCGQWSCLIWLRSSWLDDDFDSTTMKDGQRLNSANEGDSAPRSLHPITRGPSNNEEDSLPSSHLTRSTQ